MFPIGDESPYIAVGPVMGALGMDFLRPGRAVVLLRLDRGTLQHDDYVVVSAPHVPQAPPVDGRIVELRKDFLGTTVTRSFSERSLGMRPNFVSCEYDRVLLSADDEVAIRRANHFLLHIAGRQRFDTAVYERWVRRYERELVGERGHTDR